MDFITNQQTQWIPIETRKADRIDGTLYTRCRMCRRGFHGPKAGTIEANGDQEGRQD